MTTRPSDTAVTLTMDPEGIQDGKEQDAGSRQWGCRSKEWSQWAQTLTSSHTCALVAQSCPTVVRGISQIRILRWVTIPFSRGSSRPRDWTQVSCIAGRFFIIWVMREPSRKGLNSLTWVVWFSLVNKKLLILKFTSKLKPFWSSEYLVLVAKFPHNLASPLHLQSSVSELSERLSSELKSSVFFCQEKQNTQLLSCTFFFSVDKGTVEVRAISLQLWINLANLLFKVVGYGIWPGKIAQG